MPLNSVKKQKMLPNAELNAAHETAVAGLQKSQALSGFINIEDPNSIAHGAASRFQQYREQFMNMTKKSFVDTCFDIVSIIITNDSKQAIALLHDSEQENYCIRSYNLEVENSTHHLLEIKLYGKYIKAKEIN